ncbi:MAG: hypothetical protein M0007_11130 [Actinomycetota bacterium]|nr:hypothetical protein [Actinomycetota bacterium]
MTMWGGGGFGGPMGGGHTPGRPGGNLPFAGIPAELQAGVDHLLAQEPAHPAPDVSFTQVPLAASEGFLTVLVMNQLIAYSRPELRDLGIVTKTETGGLAE